MARTISSFGFNGVKNELTHATINGEEIIKNPIPMSFKDYQIITVIKAYITGKLSDMSVPSLFFAKI